MNFKIRGTSEYKTISLLEKGDVGTYIREQDEGLPEVVG
jgi:hypothetical protein